MNSRDLRTGARTRSFFRRLSALRATLVCALLAALPLSAAAQTVWTGTTGDWSSASNWSAGVPTSTTDARIDNDGTAELLAGSAAAQSLLLGYDAPDSGAVTASGASTTLAVTADFAVGYGGTGTLLINEGAVVSDYNGEIGYTIVSDTDAHGVATVDGAGSAWNHTYELYVGYGTGTLNITNGGTVTDYFGYLGYFPEFPGRSSGTANVDGAGSSWTSQSSLFVGDSGDGVLNVTGGGAVTNGEGHLGFNFDSTGTATIDGTGSSWTNFGFFYVGHNGDGTVTVSNGGALNTFGSFSYIAYSAASVGHATIDGAGSTWTNGHGFYIGFDGEGTLDITNGGVMNSDFFTNVGFSPGSSGTLNVTGAGSTFANTGALSIGGNVSGPGGTGVLRVADGAAVSASVVNIWNTGTMEAGDDASIATPTLSVDGTLRATGGNVAVDGSLALTPAATVVSNVGATDAGRLTMTGSAALAGQLVIHPDGAVAGTEYTLIEAAGGLGATTFAGVSLDPPDPDLTPQITYDANHVYLVLASSGGAALTVEPGSVDFGSVPAGITAGPATFTLTSTGSAPVSIGTISEAGAPFARSGGDCPAPPFELAPSASCTLAYTFTPTAVGPASETITVTGNAGASTISLAGTGLPGIPTTLVLVSGSDQSATVNTPFAAPLVAQMRDDYGNPVPGITVTFNAPTSGASAVLSADSVTTDADGNASVTATANGEAGSYEVVASGGLGAPVAFALTNVAEVADVGVAIVADREFARAGELVNYTITLHNAGPGAADGAAIASTLSPLLDSGAATWICVGPPESGCTASGTGDLADSGLALPAGGSVSYILTAPVRADAGDGIAETQVHASLSGDPDASDDDASAMTTLVLFRNGFEASGDDALVEHGSPVAATDRLAMIWPAADGRGIRTVLFAEGIDAAGARESFRVERFDAGSLSLARLVTTDEHGAERAGAWMPLAAGEAFGVSVLDSGDGMQRSRTLVLIGATGERQLPLATAPSSYRVRASLPLRVDADVVER